MLPKESTTGKLKPVTDQTIEFNDPSKVHKSEQDGKTSDRQADYNLLRENMGRPAIAPLLKNTNDMVQAFKRMALLVETGVSASDAAKDASMRELLESLFIKPGDFAKTLMEQDKASVLFKGEAFDVLRDVQDNFSQFPKIKDALANLLKAFDYNVNSQNSVKTILYNCANILDYMFKKDRDQFSNYLSDLAKMLLPKEEAEPFEALKQPVRNEQGQTQQTAQTQDPKQAEQAGKPAGQQGQIPGQPAEQAQGKTIPNQAQGDSAGQAQNTKQDGQPPQAGQTQQGQAGQPAGTQQGEQTGQPAGTQPNQQAGQPAGTQQNQQAGQPPQGEQTGQTTGAQQNPQSGQTAQTQAQQPQAGQTAQTQQNGQAGQSERAEAAGGQARAYADSESDIQRQTERPTASVANTAPQQVPPKEQAQLLKNNLLPLLGEIVVKYHQNERIRDVVMVIVHNIVRVDQGTPEGLENAVAKLVDALKQSADLPPGFEKQLASAINMDAANVKNMPNTVIEKLSEAVANALTSPDTNPGVARQAENMLLSMLQNQSALMDVLHFILPLDTAQGQVFTEIYVDPETEESADNQKGKSHKIFLSVESEAHGSFELSFLETGEHVDFQMWCPDEYLKNLNGLKRHFADIMLMHGYTMTNFKCDEMKEPHSIAEVFPRLLEKKVGIDVRT